MQAILNKMTTRPYGLPFMFNAWISCCSHFVSDEDALDQFQHDTGYDLRHLFNASPIEHMIDSSTGYQSIVIVAWLDWVTKNIWREEGKLGLN